MEKNKVLENEKPFFSIIIPTRNVNDYIREAIPHHLSQNYQNFEIIVITESDEKEKFAKTRYVKVGKIPPAEKRNVGVKNAKGEIIAFIDDDAYPKKDWLENAVKTFKDKTISAVGGPSLVPDKATFFQRVSNKVYEVSSKKTGMRYGEGKKREKIEIDDWPTCNFIIRKKDFLEIGGFNSKIWGAEDSQLCYELVMKKKKIIYDPEIKVYHYPRKNLKNHLKQPFFWALWRGAFLIKKYPKNAFKLTFIIPSLIVLWLIIGGVFSFFIPLIKKIYFTSLILYLIFLLFIGFKTKNAKMFFPVMGVTFLTHISYGLGFLKGLFIFGEPTKKTFNPADKKKIK